MCILFSEEQPQDFVDLMTGVFGAYRGDTKLHIEDSDFTAFMQIDERIGDGRAHEDEGNHLFEIGINYSLASERSKIETCMHPETSDIRQTLDGEICQILVSPSEDIVTVIGDPLGLRPIYFYRNDSEAILATDMKAILALRPELGTRLSKRSVVEYLACHLLMENRTLFEDIQLFPEASYATFPLSNPSGWKMETWYRLPTTHEDRPEEEWIRIVKSNLRKSIKKRMCTRVGAFLSGGLDSRTIIASVPEEYRRSMVAVTFGVEGADDCNYAKPVAKRLGVRLHHMVFDSALILDKALLHMWLSEGVSNHMVVPVVVAVQEISPICIFDGFAGDAQFGGGFHDGFDDLDSGRWPIPRLDYLIKALKYKGYIRPLENVETLIAGMSRNDIDELLRTSVSGEAQRLPENITPAIQLEMFLFQLRVKRNTLGGMISADAAATVLKPYYDLEFLETILRIPAKMRRGHLFYAKYLHSVLPDVLRDPRTTPLPIDPLAAYKKTAQIAKRVIRGSVRRALGFNLFQTKYWIPINRMIREDARYRKWMESILFSESAQRRGILDTDGVRTLLGQHLRGEKNLYPVLLSATDLELVFRLFVDRDGFRLFGGIEQNKTR
jgi:asparagine synthetase B (glutamine-hydrolysing)